VDVQPRPLGVGNAGAGVGSGWIARLGALRRLKRALPTGQAVPQLYRFL